MVGGKVRSRKFVVWITWAVLTITSLIITRELDANLITWFGTVSIIYIGGNTIQKYIFKNK